LEDQGGSNESGLEEKFGVKIMGAGRNIVFSKRKGRERVEEKCFFLFKSN